MEKLHHELWLTQAVNALLGPSGRRDSAPLGRPVPDPAHVIPDYLVMLIVFTVGLTAFALFVRSQLSVENPGRLQVLLEDFVGVFNSAARRLRRAEGPQSTCRSSAPSSC